ncbi:ester cyclase [Halorubrum sp. DTA98]|uniref:ester cyclase n=1 Tax=Halorubrum sp. DTA98 TaxID=3402163 RepID=UPI003AAB0595
MTAQTTVNPNRELAELAFSEVLNGHDLERIPDYYAADCQYHGMIGPEAIDSDEYGSFLSMYFDAFPDLSFDIDEIVTEADVAAVRWTARGTHEGSLMDIPATGEAVTVTGMSFLHIEDGEISRVHSNQDMLGLLRQLDAIPDSPRKIVRLLAGQMKRRLTRR